MDDVQTYYRTVDELSSHGRFASLEDLNAYLDFSPEKVRTFEQNPYLKTKQTTAQILGVTDGKIIGAVGVFPLHVWADGKDYEACACPLIHVHPDYRKTLYGIDLSKATATISADKMTINCGLSHMSAKMNKLFKTPVFPLRQFAYVKRSRLFFGQRIPRVLHWLVLPLMDVAFAVHRCLVAIAVGIKTRKWAIEQIGLDDKTSIQQYCELVKDDSHRFREHIGPEWVEWVLTNDFFPLEVADKRLYKVSLKGQTVGFFMTRLTEQGARGRIIEWQIVSGFEKLLPWMLMRAAKMLLRKADASIVAVGEDEHDAIRTLKHWLLPFPNQHAVIGAHKTSPLRQHDGWREAKNWRVRPAMGDGCFY